MDIYNTLNDEGWSDRLVEIDPQSDDGLLSHALLYASCGLSVLPVSSGPTRHGKAAKAPLLSNGLNGATRNEHVINNWWGRSFRGAMIGIALGDASNGLVVIDLDKKDGGADGYEVMARLSAEGFKFPSVDWSVYTPNGGIHFYYHFGCPAPQKRNFPGMDLLANGSYVIAPPSRIEVGLTPDGETIWRSYETVTAKNAQTMVWPWP